ncbi:MAG: hypothetical protein Fur005_24470 [Roseiflexaceae bacterium]
MRHVALRVPLPSCCTQRSASLPSCCTQRSGVAASPVVGAIPINRRPCNGAQEPALHIVAG